MLYVLIPPLYFVGDSMSASDVVVHCRSISKTFVTGDVKTHALRGIDLDVYNGEFMMLVGPSGCGKTTLISIIAAILGQDTGACTVFNHDFSGMSADALLAFRGQNIGFIFQSFNLIPTLSVLENISIPLLLNGVERVAALQKSYAMLCEVGLADRADSKPSVLSGGQQQRIAIARALVHAPRLVICDEPTSALDHTTGTKILELMKKINRDRQTTFLIVTHDSRIFDYADRMAHMDDGYIKSITDKGLTQ